MAESKDFRYVLDGKTVEAIQIHEGSRYDEDGWPDWLNSKMFLTTEDAEGKKLHYLKVGDAETEIPAYGWLVQNESGSIRVVEYDVMETAVKVVREVPKIPDELKPQSDDALRLAAKMTKRPFEEVRDEDAMQVVQANARRQEMIDSMHPDDAAAQGYIQTPAAAEQPTTRIEEIAEKYQPPELGQTLTAVDNVVPISEDIAALNTSRRVFDLLRLGDPDKAREEMRDFLLNRANWCDCPPGKCDGTRDIWDCRKNSPLAQ